MVKEEEKTIEEKDKEDLEKDKAELQKKKEDKKPVNEKQIKWFIITLVIIVVAILGGNYLLSESKEIDYIGLTFEKKRFNDFFIYTVQLVGVNVNAKPINFQFNLRNDPRTNDVPIEKNIIIHDKDRPVYVALNLSSNIQECGSVPLVALGQFISGMNYEPITAITTKEEADEMGKLYSTCGNNIGSTVLLITAADKTEIVVSKENNECYEIRVNNCELEEAIEKAELSILSELTGVPLT